MPKRKPRSNKRKTELDEFFFNDSMIPGKICLCQDNLCCKRQQPTPEERGKCVLQRKKEWGWLGPGTRGLLIFSLHSFSDQLFHKTGDPSATNLGFISFTALGREKRGPLHPVSVEITQGKTLKGLSSATCHMPTMDNCHG